MESIVKIAPFQQVTDVDLSSIGTLARASMDDMVATVIEGGQAYAGMVCVAQSVTAGVSTKVAVGDGFFFSAGAIFPLIGAAAQDFIKLLPTDGYKIVTIAAGGFLADNDDIEGRIFVRDVEGTRQRYQNDVATRSNRVAALTLVEGAKASAAASAVAPQVDSTRCAVADVLVTSSGIVSVTQRTDAQVGNVRQILQALKAAQLEVDAIDRITTSIQSDVAGLARSVGNKLSIDEANRIKSAVADLYAKVGLPQVYVDFGVDNCLDASQSDNTVAAYQARIEEGIRHPWANTKQLAIELLNPLATNNSIVQNAGLTLPAYDELWEREVRGGSGTIAINSFAYDAGTSLVVYTPARYRARYGEPFTVSTSSLFWNTGQYQGFFSNYGKSIFLRNGETFQVEDTGEVDSYGAPIKRLTEIWVDSADAKYWSGFVTPATAAGYRFAQTFLNGRDRIVTAIGFHLTQLPGAGNLSVGVGKTTASDAPDDTKMLTWAEQTLASLVANRPPQGATRMPFTPVLLEKGDLLAAHTATSAAYVLATTDVSNYQNGQLFYKPNLIQWQDDPSHDFLMDFWSADFRQARTVVDLKPLALDGGFHAIDVLTTAVVPDAATLAFEVQDTTGAYKAITDSDGPDLGSLPGQASWRMVFSGTDALQPMIDLANSNVIVSRASPNLYHASDLKILPAAANRITMTTRWENYDPTHHTVGAKLIVNGAEVNPSLITRTPDPNDPSILTVVSVFNFGSSPITSFRRVNTNVSNTVHNLPVIAKVGHVSNQV